MMGQAFKSSAATSIFMPSLATIAMAPASSEPPHRVQTMSRVRPRYSRPSPIHGSSSVCASAYWSNKSASRWHSSSTLGRVKSPVTLRITSPPGAGSDSDPGAAVGVGGTGVGVGGMGVGAGGGDVGVGGTSVGVAPQPANSTEIRVKINTAETISFLRIFLLLFCASRTYSKFSSATCLASSSASCGVAACSSTDSTALRSEVSLVPRAEKIGMA